MRIVFPINASSALGETSFIAVAARFSASCIREKAKLLRSWGRSSSLFDEKSEAIENRFNIEIGGIDYDAKFVFETAGYNLEGNELGAAFGLVQLESLERNIEIRERNFKIQNEFFLQYDEVFSIPQQTKNTKKRKQKHPNTKKQPNH